MKIEEEKNPNINHFAPSPFLEIPNQFQYEKNLCTPFLNHVLLR